MRGRLGCLTTCCDLIYSVIGIFDEKTDLSPDLEWMLQSGQVEDGTLIEAMAHQYYQPFYRLSLSYLTYPEEAHHAVQETFVQAFFQAKNYRGKTLIDDYYLGEIDLIDPFCTNCARSPDGAWSVISQ